MPRTPWPSQTSHSRKKRCRTFPRSVDSYLVLAESNLPEYCRKARRRSMLCRCGIDRNYSSFMSSVYTMQQGRPVPGRTTDSLDRLTRHRAGCNIYYLLACKIVLRTVVSYHIISFVHDGGLQTSFPSLRYMCISYPTPVTSPRGPVRLVGLSLPRCRSPPHSPVSQRISSQRISYAMYPT
jgi:hypothetical protein